MELQDVDAAYSADTVDKDIRDFFRAERRRLKLNQADVAAAGGIEQSTISKIERDPPYDPGLRSFLRAIRGLGMIASEFFARFESQRAGLTDSGSAMQNERQTDSDLRIRENPDKTSRTPEGRTPDGREAAAVSLDPHKLLQAGNALVDAGGLFIAAAKGVEVGPRARARDAASKRPAGQRRRAGGNR